MIKYKVTRNDTKSRKSAPNKIKVPKLKLKKLMSSQKEDVDTTTTTRTTDYDENEDELTSGRTIGGKEKKDKNQQQNKKQSIKEYPLLKTADMLTREMKLRTRLHLLKNVTNLMEDAALELEVEEEMRRKEEKWQRFIRCDGLPSPDAPADIRLFFIKLYNLELESDDKTINWLLSVKPKSVLTQDIRSVDLTRNTLMGQIRPNFGIEYEQHVNRALRVIRDIEYFLDDATEVSHTSARVVRDIIAMKIQAQIEVSQLFDRFVYRVLNSEEAYLDQISPYHCEYFYECPIFVLHLWAIKNVPCSFDFGIYPSMLADLHKINVKIQIPNNVLKDNLTIRGIHYMFDHFSEHAKSYRSDINILLDEMTPGIEDLFEYLEMEFNKKQELTIMVRNELIEQRQDYLEKMAEQLEAEEKAKKAEKGKAQPQKDKKGKAKKGPKEPQQIDADDFPDVTEDYLQFDQNQFESFFQNYYHPTTNRLMPDEINLKQYMIVGGIYQIYLVRKPISYQFNTSAFCMTWHSPGEKLFIEKDARCDPNLTRKSIKRLSKVTPSMFSMHGDKLPKEPPPKPRKESLTEEDPGLQYTSEGDHSPYFVVTFELPAYLCLWGAPTPCQFEVNVDQIVEDLDPTIPITHSDQSFFSINLKQRFSDRQSIVVTEFRKPDEIPPLLLTRMNETIPSKSVNFFKRCTTRVEDMGIPELPLDDVIVEDFRLDMPLTQVQIRNLQRYCVPRIVSSFKFPKEVAADELEQKKKKPKGRGGILVRKREENADEQTKEMEKTITHFAQNNQEREFPIYAKILPMYAPDKPRFYMPPVQDMIGYYHPETFYELLDALDMIKQYTRARFDKLMQVPDIIGRLKDNRRLTLHLQKKVPDEDKRKSEGLRRSESQIRGSLSRKASLKSIRSRKSDNEEGISKTARSSIATSPRTSVSPSSRRASKSPSSRSTKKGGRRRSSVRLVEPPKPKAFKKTQITHWTTKHILHSIYNKDKHTVTIWTDRLGTFGFAFKRYEHFPFRKWSLEPNFESKEPEVIFTLDTRHVHIVIYISSKGYKGNASDLGTGYVANKLYYVNVTEPTIDFKEFKKQFYDKNINIFPLEDARFYIENGYFSEKHLATEYHNYCCMILNCMSMKFAHSDWNRLARRRDIVMSFNGAKDIEENWNLVRLTPDGGTFVEIRELCSDDLDDIKLEYTLTWRNIDPYADLNQMILSIYPDAVDDQLKAGNMIMYLKHFLFDLRLFSSS